MCAGHHDHGLPGVIVGDPGPPAEAAPMGDGRR